MTQWEIDECTVPTLNRFNSLAGAAFAAARSGQRDKAADYYRTLLKQVDKESKRPEVRDARVFLNGL